MATLQPGYGSNSRQIGLLRDIEVEGLSQHVDEFVGARNDSVLGHSAAAMKAQSVIA